MTLEEQQNFSILCHTVISIIDSYNQQRFLPAWLFHYFHPREKQVAQIKLKIRELEKSLIEADSIHSKQDELIKKLDNYRYYLSIHSDSKRLCEKIKDALIACLEFNTEAITTYEKFIKKQNDVSGYMEYLYAHTDFESYKKFFLTQRTAYGRSIAKLNEQDIILAVKGGLINGKLLDRYGVRAILKIGLQRIRHELEVVLEKKQTAGFLSDESVEGYLDKLKMIEASIDDPASSEETLVQQARYLLEDIAITAEILPSGAAKYPQHEELLTACYWIDELFKQARASVLLY